MKFNKDLLKNPAAWGGAFLLVCMGLAALRAVYADPKRGFTIKTGNSLVEFGKSEENLPDLLAKLFADEFFAPAVREWLKTNQGLYSPEDRDIVTYLADLCPDKDEEDETLRHRAERLAACFEEKLAVAELRKRAAKEESPFQPAGLRVKVGLPQQEEHQPGSGRANACRNRGLFNKKVEVVNCEREDLRAELVVSGHYSCEGRSGVPDLQLNPIDSNRLFGANRQAYECAVVFPLPQ